MKLPGFITAVLCALLIGQAEAQTNATAPKAKAPTKAKVKGKANQPNAGLAIGENKATPVGRIKAPKDFKVELLYSVPGGDQGSWVNLCTDDKGRDRKSVV